MRPSKCWGEIATESDFARTTWLERARRRTDLHSPELIFRKAVRRDSGDFAGVPPPANMGMLEMIVRLAVVLLLLGTSAALAEDSEPSRLEQRGRALAERMCSQCHAIGKAGRSPHVDAPAFHALDRRVDLDDFMDRLREGLMSGHPDMPTFRFTREDARAFVLYLRSVQAP
jgi:mono/diheme cytochrome c family protein